MPGEGLQRGGKEGEVGDEGGGGVTSAFRRKVTIREWSVELWGDTLPGG